jgi:hypothetical protein
MILLIDQKFKYLLQQHGNRVEFPGNLMLMYGDQVYVDKQLCFHAKDPAPT